MRKLIVFGALLCLVSGTHLHAAPPEELLIFLSFDEAAGNTVTDLSPNGNDGILEGKAAIDNGKLGNGVLLDGATAYVDIPFNDSIAIEDRDFTAEIWFNYDNQVAGTLVWGYNVGGPEQQFWIRAEPADSRIRGLVRDEVDNLIVVTTDPFNDGEWHHMAFVREGSQISIYIDGEVKASEKRDGLGKVMKPDPPFGIHLGQRVDGNNKFAGTLDEFRFWGRALTEAEIKAGMEMDAGQLLAVNPNGKLPITWGRIKSNPR